MTVADDLALIAARYFGPDDTPADAVAAILARLADEGMVVLGPDGEPLDVRPALRATRLMLQMVDELQADAGVCVLSAWEPTIEDRPEYDAAHGRPSFDLHQAIPDHVWEAANAAYNAVDRPLADACLAAEVGPWTQEQIDRAVAAGAAIAAELAAEDPTADDMGAL